MKNISWGEFPNEKFARNLNAGISLSGWILLLVSCILTGIGGWFQFKVQEDFIGVLFYACAVLCVLIFWSITFGRNMRHLGLKVVNGGLDVCYVYKASFSEGDLLETKHIPWHEIKAIEVYEDPESSDSVVGIELINVISYRRGEIQSFRFGGFINIGQAKAFASDLRSAMPATG